MVELFIMEYLTVLYMIMAFLFMDSRYSRRRTIFIVSSVTLLLMAAVAVLHRAVDRGAAFWIFCLSAFLTRLNRNRFSPFVRRKVKKLTYKLMIFVVRCSIMYYVWL